MIKFDIWRLYFKLKLGVKEQIIENAISLFSENGYEGTTLNQIARSVDIKLMIYIISYLISYLMLM